MRTPLEAEFLSGDIFCGRYRSNFSHLVEIRDLLNREKRIRRSRATRFLMLATGARTMGEGGPTVRIDARSGFFFAPGSVRVTRGQLRSGRWPLAFLRSYWPRNSAPRGLF